MADTPTMRSQFEALADEIERAVIGYHLADIDGLSNIDAYEAGTDKGLAVAAKLLRAFLSSAKEPQTEGWRSMESAPKVFRTRFLAVVDGNVRVVGYGKTSHVPIYGFLLLDQGAEDCDLCKPTHWLPLPALPSSGGGHE